LGCQMEGVPLLSRGLKGAAVPLIANFFFDIWQAKMASGRSYRNVYQTLKSPLLYLNVLRSCSTLKSVLMKKTKTMQNSNFSQFFRRAPVTMITENLRLSMLLQILWSSQHVWQVSSYWSIEG
jgi:hypothetical protein